MGNRLREAGSERLEAATERPDVWGRGRWRLRDLRGRDRLFAIALLVLVLTPFAVALVRAFGDGWIPSGDEANIATRGLDVFSRHPPLTGLPSTSLLYGDQIATNHPGPIEFYLLAVPVRVLGMSAGPLLTAAVINAAFSLIALWAFFRRLGLTAMLWAGVLLLAVMWSAGTAVLTDTLSSSMTMYSVVCVAVLAWALVDGDLRLLPLASLVASYAAQQHLAAALVVLALMVVALSALSIQIVIRVRRGDTTIVKAALRWAAGAAAIAAVCWTPVAIDEITGHPGNLTKIVRFARDNTRPTMGLKSGLYQALHSVAPPTILSRTDTTGLFFLNAPRPLQMSLGVLVVAALVALAWETRYRSPAVARLALVALVLLAAGIVNGSNVPRGVESVKLNLYRWTWALALLTWTALGLGIAHLARRATSKIAIAHRATRLIRPALLLVVALIAGSILLVSGSDDHNRERPEFRAEKRIITQVLAHVDRHHPVYITSNGNDATLSVAPYIIFRLVQAGLHVEVTAFGTSTAGIGRAYQPGSHPTRIVVSSGKAERASGPGRLIALEPFGPGRTARYDELSATRTALLDRLSAEARGVKVELAPGARALIDREYSGLPRYQLDQLLDGLPTDPLTAFEDPTFVKLVLAGILRSPVVNKSKLRELADLPTYRYRGTYGDEQVEVHVINPT
ncbi:MAG TPA: hypothetical protein VIK61_01410 [Acidimicrobiia bacterium]